MEGEYIDKFATYQTEKGELL